MAKRLSRVKIIFFHFVMWAVVAPPFLAAVVLFSVSIIAYDILQHPERHQNSRRIWNIIATDLYYVYEADIWHNQKECVQYDDKLLDNPLAFFSSVFGWHDFPLEDYDPMYSSEGTPREETEDANAFLTVLAAFSELDDKKLFAMGPSRFVSALAGGTRPGNVFP